ncbi:MAG TPA: hypothetical protein VGP85_21315 [Pyrinomonadaceae bacterium]|nr:hypothetical protein [Pyrinomonadaceae bacterium]
MITGFNTDIEHDGVIYHVQTEDKGLDTPIILSLVYVGGAILASKRAPYEDLIAQGFSDEVLSERLKRQHRLICAAINSGRIEDLKKMSPRVEEPSPVIAEPISTPAEPPVSIEAEIIPEEAVVAEEVGAPQDTDSGFDLELEDVPSQIWEPPPPTTEEPPPPAPEEVVVVSADEDILQPDYHIGGQINLGDLSQEGLQILLLNDAEFNSGEVRTLRVLVVHRRGADEKPLNNIAVSIKILGTTFRPLIYSLKTDREGVASVTTQIPQFTSGRAAVLVRAVAKDEAAELRRVIHPTG